MQIETISEQLFFTTVRIDTVDSEQNRGAGTGFFYMHEAKGEKFLFVVTNKHVVNDFLEGSFSFLKMKDDRPTLGEGFRLDIKSEDWAKMWFGHPEDDIDIAICPLLPLLSFIRQNHGTDVFVRSVSDETIPNEKEMAEFDAIEPITFVGYPNGIWDSKNLLPIIRRGTTASPIEVDFEGTPRFLIDASVFGGSSGSPVFIHDRGSIANRAGGLTIGSRFHFVGVVAAVYFRTQLNEVVPAPIPTQISPLASRQSEMIDLGIVYKARTVTETVEAFLKERELEAAPTEFVPQSNPDQTEDGAS